MTKIHIEEPITSLTMETPCGNEIVTSLIVGSVLVVVTKRTVYNLGEDGVFHPLCFRALYD